MHAKTIAIQGAGTTGTGVGKSLTVALLCRLFAEDGYRVAPFKALNLTNITYIDSEGREFGYSQALQAVAAGIDPDYRMNPFTPKPLGNGRFDLILEGRVVERNYKPEFSLIKEVFKSLIGAKTFYDKVMDSVKRCLNYLLSNYDIVCIEGSGPSKLRGLGYFSKFLDIPNMETARIAEAPIFLLANSVDSVLATYLYLSSEDRRRVKGIILNRFFLKDIEMEIVEKMGVPRKLWEYGVKRVESEWLKILEKSLEIVGYVPYLDEIARLPDFDPLISGERIDMETWKKVLPKIAEKFRKTVDLKKIYRIMGI